MASATIETSPEEMERVAETLEGRRPKVLKREKLSLPVPLTGDEKITRGQELGRKVAELEDVRDRKKAAAAEFKDEEDSITRQIRDLGRTLASGKEDRLVDVEWVADYDRAVKILYRIDTHEEVRRVAMEAHEFQAKLPGV